MKYKIHIDRRDHDFDNFNDLIDFLKDLKQTEGHKNQTLLITFPDGNSFDIGISSNLCFLQFTNDQTNEYFISVEKEKNREKQNIKFYLDGHEAEVSWQNLIKFDNVLEILKNYHLGQDLSDKVLWEKV